MTRATWRRIDVGALVFLAIALVIYALSNPLRSNLYNHFVWQADAFLHGRFAIPWPVFEGGGAGYGNYYFMDVMPLEGMPDYGLLPYPPLPAVLLLPLVALSGLATDGAIVAAVIGAVNVGLAWRIARQLTRTVPQAVLATLFYGFGTVAWYASMLGSTWFLAHAVASTFLLLAIGLAINADLRARAQAHPGEGTPPADVPGEDRTPAVVRASAPFNARQFVNGMVFGLAPLARLTTLLGAPFFVFVGRGGYITRAFSAGVGAALPVLFLVAYNLASSGSVFHPAYDYAYRTEYNPRPELLHTEWAPEDLRYVPQNLGIALGSLPVVRPECGTSLLDPTCPLLQPDPIGMSLLLTSPGYLLAGGLAFKRRRRAEGGRGTIDGWLPRGFERRVVAGALLATLAIALADLAHFSQGWVQFGYRFSNDFAPFALVLVALGIARLGAGPLAIVLVGLSILVNAWGVYWGVVLRW